ncbi:MAG: type IV toxin-antitoxin system AbiEi family antitoxin, partial [Deltaproteobacteria bacterium]|nr:type IV toxin-antitoxin system AbiEi family antitoxin [Deltaproteobacteria bacterium]
LKSPAEFEADLAKFCGEKKIVYALTGFSAASRYAPVVRSNRAMAYMKGNIEKIANILQLKPVGSGANITLFFPYDDGVYYNSQNIDGIQVVSPLQAYLDLGGFRGRGDEAAEMIYKRKLLPTW